MEPAHLNSPRDEDAALAALLRAQSTDIPDDGFSARVLAALPTPATRPGPRAAARWPWLAYLGGGAAGVVVALSRAGSWPDFVSGAGQLGHAAAQATAALSEPWLAVALALTVLSLAVTLPFTRPHGRFW